jgi:hypothetical protein
MARQHIAALGLSGLLILPATLAFACHLERVSLELSCTQYKLNVKAVGVSHPHSIRYTFAVSPTSGGPTVTISKTIPVSAPSGEFTESVINPLTLVGSYDAQSFAGSASLISESGQTESTQELMLSPVTLNCAPPPPA